MSDEDTIILTDHEGREIRLTAERRDHILEHPEMVDQFERSITFEVDITASTLRFDVEASTGGNTGIVDIAAYGNRLQ